MVTSGRQEAEPVERRPTVIAVRSFDQEGTAPGITSLEVVGTTYWELSWGAVPGASDYQIYYATAEGISSKPCQTSEPRWRLSVARGIGALAGRNELGFPAQLGMMAAQVQMAVVARFADGSLDLPRDASRLATQWNESSLENEGNLQGKDRASGL